MARGRLLVVSVCLSPGVGVIVGSIAPGWRGAVCFVLPYLLGICLGLAAPRCR